MPAATILNPRPDRTETWQLLKSPTANQTAVTAAKLAQEFHSVNFAEAFEVINVSGVHTILMQVWGVAADTNTFTLELYGWSIGGPGHHIHQVTGIFGNFVSEDSANATPGFHTSVRTHKSIRDAFAAGTDYRGADTLVAVTTATYVTTSEVNANPISAQLDLEADFPTVLKIQFNSCRYHYFGVAVTAQTGTSVGAIYLPVSLWR